MESLDVLNKESLTFWTANYEKVVISILSNWTTGVKRSRKDCHVRQKYSVTSLAGISKVVLQKDSRLMATKETVLSIVKDIHVSIGHKGKKNTHTKK